MEAYCTVCSPCLLPLPTVSQMNMVPPKGKTLKTVSMSRTEIGTFSRARYTVIRVCPSSASACADKADLSAPIGQPRPYPHFWAGRRPTGVYFWTTGEE